MVLKTVIHRLKSPRWWGLFALAGGFFLLFGITSVNLFDLLKANLGLFLDYGLMVASDGALEQLLQLVGLLYLSLFFWFLFKACEDALVRQLTRPVETDQSSGDQG